MNLTLFFALLSTFSLLGVFRAISTTSHISSFLTTGITMTHSHFNCFDTVIQSILDAWLDPLQNQEGALPPDALQSAVPIQGPETHALNVELTLINPSRHLHTAHVLSGSWQQGEIEQAFSWEQQPDLSPLNHFQYIQRKLLQLKSKQPVYVHLNMEINGQACVLNAKTAP